MSQLRFTYSLVRRFLEKWKSRSSGMWCRCSRLPPFRRILLHTSSGWSE